jgi:hypothetical protein
MMDNKIEVPKMTDEKLLAELIYWFRVGRAEEGLHGEEHKYFQEICKEAKKRNLIQPRPHLLRD